MEDISLKVYGDANRGFKDFHGDDKNIGKIDVYNKAIEDGHTKFRNFTDENFDSGLKVKDHYKLIGGLFGWIRKLSDKPEMQVGLNPTFCSGKTGDDNKKSLKISEIKLGNPNNSLKTNYPGELKVTKNTKKSEDEAAQKILAPIYEQKHRFNGSPAEPTPFFWEIWDARETSGAPQGGISPGQAEGICNAIVKEALENGKEGDILSALDVLMSATQILPMPDGYRNEKIDKFYTEARSLYNTSKFAELLINNKNTLKNARKKWLDDLTSKIIDKYIGDIYKKASVAIDYQNFNFRDENKKKFSDEAIKGFYQDQGKRDTKGKLANFTLGKNLAGIKADVAKSLGIFQAKVKEIRDAYLEEFEGTGQSNTDVVRPWKDAIDDGAKVINKLLNSKIENLNNKIEAKIDEKSDYLSDLFREADFYIRNNKPLPTFLLDPANSYTELGLTYVDQESNPDPLFKGCNDSDAVIARLAKFKFDLTGYPAEDLKKSGFDVAKTERVIKDEKGNSIKTKDKAHVFYGNESSQEYKNTKFFLKDTDFSVVNDEIANKCPGCSFKKENDGYYSLQISDTINDYDGLRNYLKNEREKIEIEKTYWTLTANNDEGNESKVEDIKKLFLSAPGRPRQVPNIYFDNDNGSEPQQIYSREFLAVYQKGLVEEIKNAAKNNKDNKVQVNKCYFFTGEGKTHVVQRITNDIKFRKQADALLGLGGVSNEEIVVLDFNLQNDNLEEIKNKILIETLLSINPDKGYEKDLKLKSLEELIIELTNKKGKKKFNFIIQADEDPHMSAAIKQFFYLDVHNFLTKECKLSKEGEVGNSLGSINLISISGTPKQKRHDHLISKIEGYVASNQWFGKDGKKSQYTNTETGKKEIRALENFQAAYQNISGLLEVIYLETNNQSINQSIEDRIAKNVSEKIQPKKESGDARHIQYLMPDLSASDSALLFAPSRLENLVKVMITKQVIADKNEFFVLLPPVSDSIAKEIRAKADDLSSLSEDDPKRKYINLLEKKKIVKFEKQGGEWKLTSVSEGLEKELDKEENSKRDSICFYDQNTVVGGDYGKFSRDVTDFYIDDLSGKECGTDDLAQWIARNRTMNLRDDSVVDKVTNQCNFYYCGKQENLDQIKINADKSASLVAAQLKVVNADGESMGDLIKNYNNNVRELIQPANDNDLTPLKKITERLNRLKLNPDQINNIIQELDAYADKNQKLSKLLNPYDENQILDNLFELSVFKYFGKSLDKNNSEIADSLKTANLYAKEYVEQKRVVKQDDDKSVNLKLFTRRLPDASKSVKGDALSQKLEASPYKDAALGDVKLRDYFSCHELLVGKDWYDVKKKKNALKSEIGIDEGKSMLPAYTILDVIRLKNEDNNYSNSDIKKVIRQQNLDQYLNITLDKLDISLAEFQAEVKAIEDELVKETREKKQPKERQDFKNAKAIVEGNNIKITLDNLRVVPLAADLNNNNNIFKDAKNIIEKLEEIGRLKEDLKLISDNRINPSVIPEDEKNKLFGINTKIDSILQINGIESDFNRTVKVLKEEFSGYKTISEKNNKEDALSILPNSFVEKAKSDLSKLSRLAGETQKLYETQERQDNLLPQTSTIDEIEIIDSSNLLFSKEEIEKFTKEPGGWDFLRKKLFSCLNLSPPPQDFADSQNKIEIKVTSEDIKIKHGTVSTTATINPVISQINDAKSELKEVMADHKTKLEDFHKKLKSKRNRSEVKEDKIGLYYVNQSDKQEDNVNPDDKSYRGSIPHLIWERKDPEDNKKIITNIALSKQAYKEELLYLTNTEESLKEYLTKGFDSKENAKKAFNAQISSFTNDEQGKIMALGCLPIIPLKSAGGSNFASSLERDGTKVKVSFMTDEVMTDEVLKKKPTPNKNWPEDAPVAQYVQVNGTGLGKGGNPLKLKFAINKLNGNLEYQGIYRYIENKPVPITLDGDISVDEKRLIKKMQVLVTWQTPSKIHNQITLKQAVFFNGDSFDEVADKAPFATKKLGGPNLVTFKVENSNLNALKNAELKIKPSPMAVPRELPIKLEVPAVLEID